VPASPGHDPVAERSGDEPPPVAPPAWAVAADVLTLVLLASALFVVVAGRGLLLAFGQFVLPSAAFFLFLALATLGIRHVAHPTPGIRATFARWREWLNARPPVAAALRAFLVTRPLVFFVGYFAVVTFGFPKTAAFSLSADPLGNLPARFDAGWYGGIALDGYEWDHQFGRQRNIAFFPALPMLMRPAGAFIGMNQSALPRDKRMLRALWAGVFVSLIAFGFALYYVARLGQLLTDQYGGAMAPLLLATYPFAVFFNAPYTESLFLLGSVGAFYYFHRGQWIAAALFGLLVGFSRPNGCLVSMPLGVLAIEPAVRAMLGGGKVSAWLRPVAIRLLVASMPGVAMLLFTAYLYRLTGVWLAWARMHGAWGRKWGTGPLTQGWEWLTTEGFMPVFQGVPYDTLNTLAVVFAVLLVWPVFRRLGLAYGLFVLVNLVPPIFAGGALSMGRVTSTLFPLFIVLAAMIPARAVPAWTASFALLQGFVAAIFFTWRELF
jgi:Mannosyltransferase (PIG-V)